MGMARTPKRRRRTRIARLLLGLALLLVAALVSAVLWLQSDDAAERLRLLLVRVGSEQLGGDLYVRDVQVEQLLPPAVRLVEVSFHSDDGRPLATVDEVRLALDALPNREVIPIRSLQVVRPRVRLAVEGGKLRDFQPPQRAGPQGGQPGPKVQLAALQVEDAAALVTLAPAGVVIDASGVELAFQQDDAGNGVGTAGAARVALAAGAIREQASLAPSNFTVESGVVTLGDSIVDFASGRVQLGGVVGLPDPPGAPQARPMTYGLTARAEVELPELRSVWPQLPSMEGRVDVALGLSGQGKEPLVTFNVQGHAIVVHLTKPRPLVLKGEDPVLIGHFRDGHVVIETESALHWGGGVIKPEGWFDLRGDMPFEIDLEMRGLRLEQVLDSATVPGSWVTMGIDGHGRLEGTAKAGFRAGGYGHLVVDDMLVSGVSWEEPGPRPEILRVPRAVVDATISMTGKHCLLSPATITGPDGTVLDASVDFLFLKPLGLVIDVKSRHFELSDVDNAIAGLHVEGVGQVEAFVEGPTKDLDIRGSIELDDFVFTKWPFGQVGGDVHWHSRSDLEFTDLLGRRGSTDFESEVRVLFADVRRGGMREKLEINVDAVVPKGHGRAEDLLPIFFGDAIGVTGDAWGRASLEGPPAALNGEGSIAVRDAAYLWERFDSVDLDAEVRDGRLTITEAFARKLGGDVLFGRGSIAPGGAVEFEFRLPTMELAELEPIRRLFPHGPSSDLVELAGGTGPWVSGRVSGNARIGGTLKNITLDGRVELANLIYRGNALGDARVDFEIEDHLLLARGGGLDGTLSAEAELRTDGLWKYDYRLGWTELDLTPLLPRTVLTQVEPVTAGMSGRLDGDGTLRDSFHDVVLTLDDVWLERGRHKVQAAAGEDVEIGLERGAIQFRQLHLVSAEEGDGRTDFTVSGWIRPDGPLSVKIRGRVDVAFADLAYDVFDRAEAQALILDFDISGRSTSAVEIEGRGVLEGALLKTIYWPHPIQVDRAVIELDQGYLRLVEFAGRMGGGTLQKLDGSYIRLDRTGYKPREYDLRAECMDCTVRYPSYLPPASGDMKLRFVGTAPDQLVLRGDIFVKEMVLRDPLNWQRSVLTFQSRFTETVAGTDRAGLFDIDLLFRSDEGALGMRNNVGELSGTARDFRVRGDTNHVILEGTVELEGGTIPYKGHDFEMEGGFARFRDSESWFPELEGVRMTTDVVSRDESYEITYRLSGPLNGMQLESSATPYLTESDINLLLLFGLTQEQLADADVAELLAAGGGAGFGTYTETAATSFGQSVGGSSRVADILVPDRVEIAPVYTDTTGATTVWAVATKEVVPDLLTLEGGVGVFTTGELQLPTVARAQLKFQRNLYLEGSWLRDDAASTAFGNFGLDLKFEVDVE